MHQFWTEPKHKSQTIKGFLDQGFINKILKDYQHAKSVLTKSYRRPIDIHEVNTKFYKDHFILNEFKIGGDGIKQSNLPVERYEKLCRRLNKRVGFEWFKDTQNILEDKFKKHNIPSELVTLNIHNLPNSFEIHTDGVNITHRDKPRPDSFPHYPEHKYVPIEPKNFSHQGLITLQNNGPKNGTIIFDQWCPISTYLVQDENYNGHYKSNIRFHRGESLERFGVKVNGYTNTDLPDEDYDIITKATDGSITKEKCHGLTLDEILLFGDPGNLSVWAVKKYHLPVPLGRDDWSQNRIMLQYEAKEINKETKE